MNKNIKRRRISDSALTDFISKSIDRVSTFAKNNPKKAFAIGSLAPTITYLIFKIACQYIDSAREIKKIKAGQFDERQFVDSYKNEFNSMVDRAKLDLVKKLGPEGRRQEIINQYLDDALEEQAEINRCRTVRELADVSNEIKLKRIADALDAYKSQNNIKDSAKLLGAVRLMNARLPGATFCSRRYGDGINMKHYVYSHSDSLALNDANVRRRAILDRCYRDGVIAIAKDKVKSALSKAKQLASKHPRLTKALSIMLAALATGSAIAIARARKQVQPVFESIGPDAQKQPEVLKTLKEAFGWFKKSESAFNENAKRFSGKKDSALVKKKCTSTAYLMALNKKSSL